MTIAHLRRGSNCELPSVGIIFDGYVTKHGSVLSKDVFLPQWPDNVNLDSLLSEYSLKEKIENTSEVCFFDLDKVSAAMLTCTCFTRLQVYLPVGDISISWLLCRIFTKACHGMLWSASSTACSAFFHMCWRTRTFTFTWAERLGFVRFKEHYSQHWISRSKTITLLLNNSLTRFTVEIGYFLMQTSVPISSIIRACLPFSLTLWNNIPPS